MPHLLFSGDIDFTISELDSGCVTVAMFNHAPDATNIYADTKLDRHDLICLKEWVDNQLRKFDNKSEAP